MTSHRLHKLAACMAPAMKLLKIFKNLTKIRQQAAGPTRFVAVKTPEANGRTCSDYNEALKLASHGGSLKSPNNKSMSSNYVPEKPRKSDADRFKQTEQHSLKVIPIKNNSLYDIGLVTEKLNKFPVIKIRREGKYYVSSKNVLHEPHPKFRRDSNGIVIPTINKEFLNPIESIVSRFCEDVLCISRAKELSLNSQGERHLIWVGAMKAKQIINRLTGNGCFIVNRFPGDIFLKDKQVMGVTLRRYMLERHNYCLKKCGSHLDYDGPETYRICSHMVGSMQTDKEGCKSQACFNYRKTLCKHMDIFIPEVQSFSSYNALQLFSNRLDGELKGQLFVCKPAYLTKGRGFQFFHRSEEFQKFYHMTLGKETSRHDFLVQRMIDEPYLFDGYKVDIRAFLLIVTLRNRRVVAFLNPGFCRIASVKYESFTESEDNNGNTDAQTINKMRQQEADALDAKMQMLVCSYQSQKEKADRAMRISESHLLTVSEDRSKKLEEVFGPDSLLATIKDQITHIGIRIATAIENKIWDAYGCYQIFGMDFSVDQNDKVWLLDVNSHAMNEVDILSPTQRAVVPAVIMESLGLVMECMFKSSKGLRLRKSPYNEFEETGLLFQQNFDFVFSTLVKRRSDYVQPRQPVAKPMPFYHRVELVEHMITQIEARRRAQKEVTERILAERAEERRKRKSSPHASHDSRRPAFKPAL